MSADYIYEPLIYLFEIPLASWIIEHRLKRSVAVNVFNQSGEYILPQIIHQDTDTVVINFFENGVPVLMTGKVVIS